ncbi:peroxiredoxin-like family protein [Acidobacteriota bacterium]
MFQAVKTVWLLGMFLLCGTLQAGDIPDSADKISPLLVGAKVPSLVLTSIDNELFDLNEAIAQKPAVLIFYRGSWCPYCNRHLSELKDAEAELIELGYQIFALSPDKPENLKTTLEKNEIKYTLLSDSKMEAASAFGIAFKVRDETLTRYEEYGIDLEASSGEKHHLLPVPAVFLVSTDGMILFHYVNPNYKVRLKKEVILAAAKAFQ